MWNNKLSKEILGIFVAAFFISAFSFWTLNEVANIIVLNYVESELLVISEYQLIDIQYGILGVSFLSAIILFIILFLSLVAERLAYISDIVKGIDALGRHEWDYEIPLRGENELTELAQIINRFSKDEQAFQEKEKQMQEEKNALVRSLSHDIRTPLTSMMAYSEFMKQKDDLTAEEMKTYMDLVEQKSQQIKVLTDRLLDGSRHQLEVVENGRFLVEQLVDEWASELEEEFVLEIDMKDCPRFTGAYDVQELRRVFDNLTSNIRKYADEKTPVVLKVCAGEDSVCIYQSNTCKKLEIPVESMKIGLDSIRKIVAHHGGIVEVFQDKEIFRISLELPCKFL